MLFSRRAFVALLGYAVVSHSIPAASQSATSPRVVGVLMGFAKDAESQARVEAFEQGLKDEGWSIGKDLRIEYQYSGGNIDRMQALAKEFVTLKPDCILGHSTPVVKALTQVTRTIPIVFVAVIDPIASGFVASITRPGGNATGFSVFTGTTMAGKYLSILRDLIPQLSRAAIIYNPESVPATVDFLPTFTAAAASFQIEPITLQVSSTAEIESSIAQLAQQPGIGLIVMPDNFLSINRQLLITLAARYQIPAVYPYRYFAEEGGLLSYGIDATDLFRRAAGYISRILRGANPAELPVQAPTKFELAINLKTAKALGITVPNVVRVGADRIIE